MSGEQVVAAARQCLGTPFQHQGRVPGQALDCLGLIHHVASAVGHHVRAPRAYPEDPGLEDLLAGAEANRCVTRVSDLAAIQAGDVLLLQIGSHVRHLAIYGGPTLIHVWSGGVGQVCEHVIDNRWRRRFVAAYRFVEGAA